MLAKQSIPAPSESALAKLDPIVFSTDQVASSERFDTWRAQFGSVHDVEVEPHQRAGFQARGRNWHLGSVLLGVFETPARRVVRTPEHIRQDDLDHVFLRVLKTGEIRSRSPNAILVLKPGDVAIGSYSGTYDEEQTAGEWVTAIFARDALPALQGQIPEPQRLQGVPARLLAEFFLSLAARLEGLAPEEAAQVENMIVGVVSACIGDQITFARASSGNRTIALRDRVDQIISAQLSSPRLTPARIAETAGVSRSTLYRMYEADGGVANLILRRRLDLIWRDLQAPSLGRLPLSQIAERRGLHNAASFHRAFRRQFGQTPGEARFGARVGPVDGIIGSEQPKDAARFADLLRQPPTFSRT